MQVFGDWIRRPDQLAGVEFAMTREAAGLFAKPGVGKKRTGRPHPG